MDTAEIVRAFAARMEAREWDAFGALLAPDVVYEIPQTRERIRGRENYVRFNAEYPRRVAHRTAGRAGGRPRRRTAVPLADGR